MTAAASDRRDPLVRLGGFNAGLHLYGQRLAHGNASTRDFRQAMEGAAGQPLGQSDLNLDVRDLGEVALPTGVGAPFTVAWNRRDDTGRRVVPGLSFAQVTVGGEVRIVLVA